MPERSSLHAVVLTVMAAVSLGGSSYRDSAPARIASSKPGAATTGTTTPRGPSASAATIEPAASAAAPPEMRWVAANGAVSWSVRLDTPAADAPLVPLATTPRFPPFPPVDFQLLDGTEAKYKDFAGRVLLLDFWASWCAPCLEELPHLQKLYDEERERGLAAVAVNADEPLPVARATAEKLKLSLPIGIYDAKLRELFAVRTLPTLVLVDRQGRIRGRWDGYNKGLERTIADRVRVLLGDDPEGRSREIAKVADGAGEFEVAWALEMNAAVSGVAALGSTRTDAIAVAAAAGDQLVLADAAGNVERRLKLPSPAWRLAAPELPTQGGEPDVLAFRWGASEVISIDLDQGLTRGWSAPGPIFGLAFAAPSKAGEGQRVWLATLEGIGRADLAGYQVQRIDEALSYLSAAPGASSGVVALARDGTVRRLTAFGTSLPQIPAPEGARQVITVSNSTGVGVLAESVTASAVGALRGGAARQAAIATYDGVLAIVDLESGRVLFRALWPGVVALAARDLDGDGRDELLVGAGRNIVALRARAPEAATGN